MRETTKWAVVACGLVLAGTVHAGLIKYEYRMAPSDDKQPGIRGTMVLDDDLPMVYALGTDWAPGGIAVVEGIEYFDMEFFDQATGTSLMSGTPIENGTLTSPIHRTYTQFYVEMAALPRLSISHYLEFGLEDWYFLSGTGNRQLLLIRDSGYEVYGERSDFAITPAETTPVAAPSSLALLGSMLTMLGFVGGRRGSRPRAPQGDRPWRLAGAQI